MLPFAYTRYPEIITSFTIKCLCTIHNINFNKLKKTLQIHIIFIVTSHFTSSKKKNHVPIRSYVKTMFYNDGHLGFLIKMFSNSFVVLEKNFNIVFPTFIFLVLATKDFLLTQKSQTIKVTFLSSFVTIGSVLCEKKTGFPISCHGFICATMRGDCSFCWY